MYVCMYVCTYVCVRVCMYVCTCVHTNVCTLIPQMSYLSRTLNQHPSFLIEVDTAHFSQGSLTVNFAFLFNWMGCFLLFCQPHLWTLGVDQPSPATETRSPFHNWCGRLLPSWSFTLEARCTSHSATTTVSSVCACFLLTLCHAGTLKCRVPSIIIFSLLLSPAFGGLVPLHRRRCKKWGRLHSNAQSHPRPACCSQPLLLCARVEGGRGEKAEQQSHQVNEYWSHGRSF